LVDCSSLPITEQAQVGGLIDNKARQSIVEVDAK
jgi:hypothetical protein